MKKLLLKCQLENRPVDIIYLDRQGRITKRTVFVKKIDQDKVMAFCTLRDQNRTFDLRNILAAQKGSEYFENQQNHTWTQPHVGVIKDDVTRAQRSISTSSESSH